MKLLLLAVPAIVVLVLAVAMFSTPKATPALQTVDIPLENLLPKATPGA